MIRRRDFITLLGGVAAALPLAAKGQQGGAIRRIGVLLARTESDPYFQARLQTFRTRLQQLGWTDGDNLRIGYRWTAGIAPMRRSVGWCLSHPMQFLASLAPPPLLRLPG